MTLSLRFQKAETLGFWKHLPEGRTISWGVGVSLGPEHQGQVPAERGMSGHFLQLSGPDLLICNTMVVLRVLLGSDWIEDGKLLFKLKTLYQGRVICALEKPGMPQKSLRG